MLLIVASAPVWGVAGPEPDHRPSTWAMGLVDPSAMTGAREHPPNGGLRAAASCRMRRSGTGSRSVGSPMRSRSATGVRASATTAASPGAPATGAAHALKTLNRTTAPSTPQPAGRRRLHRTGCLNGRLWGSRPATDTDPGSRSASPHPGRLFWGVRVGLVGLLGRSGAGSCPNLPQRRPGLG